MAGLNVLDLIVILIYFILITYIPEKSVIRAIFLWEEENLVSF